MSRLLTILAVLAVALPASAQRTVDRMHPEGIDARALERHVEIRIEADGRMTRTESRVIEFLTDHAMETYSDPSFVHDADSQTLTVEVARTIAPDGRVENSPDIARNELTLPELAAAPSFASIRQNVVSLVGVQIGSRGELTWTVEDTRPPASGFAEGEVALQWAIPIEKFSVTVQVPADATFFRYDCVECDLEPAIGEADGMRMYTWSAEDVPPIDLYENSAHVGSLDDGLDGPRIVFGTGSSTSLGTAFRTALETATEVTDAVRRRAEALTADCATDSERTEVLQAFVAEAIGGVPIPQGLPWRPPAAAETVLDRSYGTPIEKAALLVALLGSVGIDSSVRAFSDRRNISPVALMLTPFREATVVTSVHGLQGWLATDRRAVIEWYAEPCDRWVLETEPFSSVHFNSCYYREERGGSRETRILEHNDSLAAAVGELSVAEDGAISGDVRVTFTGPLNPWATIRGAEADPAARLGSAAAAIVPGGEATETTIEAFDHPRASAAATVGGHAVALGHEILAVPLGWPGPDPLPGDLHRSSRQTPLELDSPFRRSMRVEIAIPDGWEVGILPRSTRVDSAVASFSQEASVANGTVTIERTLEVRVRTVEPTDYPSFLRVIRAFRTAGTEPLVIRRKM